MTDTHKARENVVQSVIELRGLPRRSPAQDALVTRINDGLDTLIEAARKEGRRNQRDVEIESLLTILSEEFDAAVQHHETKGKGGQSCTFTGDFASVGPGTLARMRRWLRDMRKALGTVTP